MTPRLPFRLLHSLDALRVNAARRLPALAVCLAFICTAQAQTDTEFWFVAPEVSNHPGAILDRPIFLRVTTYAQPATVTVSQPAGGGMPVQTLTIAANSTQSLDLTPWIDFLENKPPNTVLNYGLKITATAPVTAYYDVVSGGGIYATNNPEAFSLKGRNALGTDFLIPAQNYLNNANYNPLPYNAFDIVATENSTTVTITPSNSIVGHAAGTPFTITLNAGQTWSGTASSQLAAAHLQGSRVTSDKPVAITEKDDLLAGTPFGGCADLAGDQIVPVPLLGTEYIAMKGILNNPGDQLFITATQNGTTITHNGTAVATINAGATYQLAVASPSSYIQTNYPVSVWQLSGLGCEVGACQLPQIKCTGSSSVSYTRATNTSLYFNLLVKSGGQGDFLVNGAAGVITAGLFTAVPNSGGQWYTAQVSLPSGTYPQGSVINVSNASSLFHLGVLEGGTSGGTSYGYFSNFGFVAADASASTGQVCVGDTIRLFANTVQGATYQWTGPGGFNSLQQNPVIPHAAGSGSGVYTLTVDLAGCGSGTDTVHVAVNDYPVVNLGNDLSVCADTLTIRFTPPNAGATYLWSTGATTDSLKVNQSGTYWVKVSRGGCVSSDTIAVELKQSVSVDLGPDIGICDRDTPYVLTSPQPPGVHYLWSNGLSLPQLSVYRTDTYWLEVSLDGCKDSDTIFVKVVPTPAVDIGADSIICEQWPLRIGDEVPGADYLWSTGATSPYIDVAATGSYQLEVNLEGCIIYDTVAITAMPSPVPDLGADRDLCAEQTMTLSANYSGNGTYLWSTGETTADIEVADPGVYRVTVTSEYGCTGSDTVTLTPYPLPMVSLGADTTVCEGGMEPVVLKPWQVRADSLLWSDGSVGNTLVVRDAGTYIVTGINKCGTDADTITVNQIFCDIWLPNIFTPNGDGVNDRYHVLGTVGRLGNFSFGIFNRWGERVFYTQDRYAGWDGMYKGTPAPLGTYAYLLEYTLNGRPVLQKGNFHLVR